MIMLERAARSFSVRGLALGVVIVATTACGAVGAAGPGAAYGPPASASSGAGAGTPVGDASVVNMTDRFRFEPATLTVPKSTTVTWKNTGQAVHTVTGDPAKASNTSNVALPEGAPPWDS